MAIHTAIADSEEMEAGDDFTLVEREMVPTVPIAPGTELENQRRELLNWLQPTDYLSPGNEYMKHLHSYVPGTGKWVEESPIFRSWRGDDMTGNSGADTDSGYHHIAPATGFGASCLHLRGVAGSGKSVVSASTIHQLQAAGNIVLFFFFRQIVEKNHAAKYLIRDFAAQLLPHSEVLVRELLGISKFHSISDVDDTAQVGVDLVWSAISKVITEGAVDGQVFCVVDALDEMDDVDFPDMMAKLLGLGSANPQTVRTMFTGRPLPKIEEAVSKKSVLKLKLDPVLLSPDVARYVDARMASLETPLSSERNELVKQAICTRANGLFLHARLVADNLAQNLEEGLITEETLPDSLDRLPRSLREVYEEMLKQHSARSGVSADHQAKVLTCVTHSSRPLRLIELGSLVAQMFDVDLRRGKDLVRASCGRLLDLLEDETVSIIHHSFTEFLHDNSRAAVQNAFPVLVDSEAHDMLAALCLEYLDSCPHFDTVRDETEQSNYRSRDFIRDEENRRDTIRTQLRLSHPLASYAVENLGFHFAKSYDSLELRGIKVLDALFLPNRPAFETWVLMKYEAKLTSAINVLHLLVNTHGSGAFPTFVIEHVAEANPVLVDLPDPRRRTPLIIAAKLGRDDVVRYLISKGARTKGGSEDGFTPLHWAAMKGHAATVQVLLEAGVSPLIEKISPTDEWEENDTASYYGSDLEQEKTRTALWMAMHGDSLDVISQFIAFIPPEEATFYFHRAQSAPILEAIVATGLVDINSYAPKYSWIEREETKLISAAKAGKLDMVKVLLENGADPNKREAGQPTALHAMAGVYSESKTWYEGEEDLANELVRILVEAGADINAPMTCQGDARLSPLHVAVAPHFEGGEDVVSNALLKAGADPNALTMGGNTPLHRVRVQNLKLMQLLVANGADVNRENAAGMPPLLSVMQGLARGCSGYMISSGVIAASVNGLLDFGADPSATDENGSNILHYMMRGIQHMRHPNLIPTVKRLLKAVNLNHKNRLGDTPLFWYDAWSISSPGSRNSEYDDPLLLYLVQNGMRLDARDREGDTILHRLRGCNGPRIADMQQFVRLGADPNALSLEGLSTFERAVRSNSPPEWLEYLFNTCSQPFSAGKNGDTIIHSIFTHMKESKRVKIALDLVVRAGANPLAKNNEGQSILHIVSARHVNLVMKSELFQKLAINERDKYGFTPLHYLIKGGGRIDEDLVANLLAKGADPFVKSNSGLLPLHYAAKIGRANIADLLMGQYASQSALLQHINSLGEGFSPLHYACQAGSATTVAVLLWHGADPNVSSESGLSSLHMLSKFVPDEPRRPNIAPDIWTPEIVQLLYRAGADIDITISRLVDKQGVLIEATALDLAIESQRWEVVRELLACGARLLPQHKESPEFLLATDKEIALEALCKMKNQLEPQLTDLTEAEVENRRHYAHYWQSRWNCKKPPAESICQYILGPQTILEPPEKQDWGYVSRMDVVNAALANQDFDTIKEYHELGHDIFEIKKYGRDFLQCLVHYGHSNLLRYFAEKAGQQNRKVKAENYPNYHMLFSSTLLGEACNNLAPSMHIIEWLVNEVKVDINQPHMSRIPGKVCPLETPLHILSRGVSFWHIEALKYLLSKGADIEARSHDGLTPLLVALDEKRGPGRWNSEAVRLLLKHGANVNALSKIEPGNWEVEKIDCCSPNTSALDLAKKPVEFKLLLAAGADTTLSTGLIMSNIRNQMIPETIEVLLDAGLDPDEEPLGGTPDGEDKSEYDTWGSRSRFNHRYALHEAARPSTKKMPGEDLSQRQAVMVKLLLSRGANPYSIYADGTFVLQRIVEDRGLISTCISSIKDLKVNMIGLGGRTLLIQACVPGLPVGTDTDCWPQKPRPVPTAMADAVQILLEKGADATLTDDDGRSALHWFCTQTAPLDEAGREAFKNLVRKSPRAINMPDDQGRTPFHLALEAFSCRKTSMDFAIRHLIANGANISLPDPNSGDSALHYVARSMAGTSATAMRESRALFEDLAKSLDINARNDAGEAVVAAAIGSPFPVIDLAESNGYSKVAVTAYSKAVKFLVKLGATLDVADAKGRNLLHICAERHINDDGYRYTHCEERDMITDLFETLLDFGLDPHKEDNELRTPIDIAVARELPNVIYLFSEEGRRAAEERKLNNTDSYKEYESDGAETDSDREHHWQDWDTAGGCDWEDADPEDLEW